MVALMMEENWLGGMIELVGVGIAFLRISLFLKIQSHFKCYFYHPTRRRVFLI